MSNSATVELGANRTGAASTRHADLGLYQVLIVINLLHTKELGAAHESPDPAIRRRRAGGNGTRPAPSQPTSSASKTASASAENSTKRTRSTSPGWTSPQPRTAARAIRATSGSAQP